MSSRARNAIAAAAILAAALAVFGPPLFRGEVFTYRDHVDYFQPLRLFTTQHLRAGRLPLWNPYNASGEPWLANPQTAIFYPPAWIFLVLPFSTAYVGYLFLHALLLGAGAYRLLLRSASPPAALLGTIGLMLSGPVLSLLDVSNNFTTFAWVPLVMWRALEDRDRPRRLVAAALLALAFLGGEPFFAAVAALAYAAIVRKPSVIVPVAAGAAGLSAIQLVPFAEMVMQSDRVGGFAAADVLRASMPLVEWRLLAVPPRIAHPSQQFVPIVYCGVLMVALAVAGIFALASARRWPALGTWLGILMGVAIVASGPTLLARLPLTLFRYPARVVPFAVIAVAALAAAGWSRLRRGSAVVDAVLIVAVAAELMAAVKPLLVSAPFGRVHSPYADRVGRDGKVLQDYGDVTLRGGGRAAWIAGYLNLDELRFVAFTAAPATSKAYLRLYTRSTGNLELLRRMGVGYVLTRELLPPAFEPLGRAGEVLAYRIRGALPMAYVIARSGAITPVRSLALDASRAIVRTATVDGGLLVLTQNDAEGWSVAVDGRPARAERVFGTFRSVAVPAGVHEIEWRYRPLSFVAGAVVTMFSCAVMLIAAAAHVRSHDALSRVARTKIFFAAH